MITKIEEKVLNPREGACGICHAIAEEICKRGGKIVAYERQKGILARIFDAEGEKIGEGLDIVWSSAILAAEIDTGIIPEPIAYRLRKEGTTTEEDIERAAALYGYGRVVAPAVIALDEIKSLGGRTIIKREGLGVVSIFLDKNNEEISKSPITYCPTCATFINAARADFLVEEIKERLKDVENTGKKKYELGIENVYEAKRGGIWISLRKGEEILAERTFGCCITYGTTKAEVEAGLVSGKSVQLFKAYCNLCPLKHCWLDKPAGAIGNIVLSRLSELNIEVEIDARGYIIARIPGEGVIEGRGTLCSLRSLADMLLREDARKILKPEPVEMEGMDIYKR